MLVGVHNEQGHSMWVVWQWADGGDEGGKHMSDVKMFVEQYVPGLSLSSLY